MTEFKKTCAGISYLVTLADIRSDRDRLPNDISSGIDLYLAANVADLEFDYRLPMDDPNDLNYNMVCRMITFFKTKTHDEIIDKIRCIVGDGNLTFSEARWYVSAVYRALRVRRDSECANQIAAMRAERAERGEFIAGSQAIQIDSNDFLEKILEWTEVRHLSKPQNRELAIQLIQDALNGREDDLVQKYKLDF
jgi:hypothetical protein